MKYCVIILIFGSTFFSSCTDKKVSTRLTNISELQSKVDSSKTVVETIQLELIQEHKTTAEEQLQYLKEHYHDTGNFENAKYIDVYNSNFKLMRKLMSGHKRVTQEILYSEQQLDNLYSDTKNDLINDSIYSRYYSGEEKAVTLIINTANTLKNWEVRSIKRFNGMTNSIDSVILELQKRGYR